MPPARAAIAARGRRPSPPPRHYNEPGRFTAFIGYEWTSLDKGNNLHRNVIFRDNADQASQVEPFTCYPPLGSTNPVDLWKWMDAYEKKTGGSVLAIAHNGNLSNGDDVPDRRGVRQSDRPRVCRAAREVGAALRGHADEGRRRGASLPLAERRVRRLRDCGTRATSTAAWRRRRRCSNSNTPARRSRTASSSRRSSARTPTSSASSAAATRTPASPPSRRTISSARPRRRSPARIA